MTIRELFSIKPRMLIATAVGAVIFTLTGYFIMLPTPVPGIYFLPALAVLGVFATLFGPVSGVLIALTGQVVVSLLRGVFFESYTPAYTAGFMLCGFIFGLAKKYSRIDEGRFNDRDIIAYNFFQVLGNLIAFALVTPLLLLSSGSPPRHIFLQGLTAAFVDILAAEFIGTPVLFVYSRFRRNR